MKFNEQKINGNPFDIIIQSAIMYLRGTLFDVIRYRGDTIAPTDETYLIDRIRSQYKLLNEMSDDEVKICKENSVLYKECRNHNEVNDFLFAFEQAIPTVWSECNPIYEPSMEKLFFGDSSDFYRRKELKKLTEQKIKEFGGLAECDHFLSNCIDVIDNSGLNPDAKKFVSEYMLSINDIELMKSVIRHQYQRKTRVDIANMFERICFRNIAGID